MSTYSFGPKNAWVAVPDISAAELAAALGYETLEPSEWEEGVEFCYSTTGPRHDRLGVFVTPPLGRWTLCAGWPLFDRKKGFAADLSERLGGREVQYFATHRVTETHVVERAIDGKLTRHLFDCGCDGEHAEEGEPTPGEFAAGYTINPPDDEIDEEEGPWSPNEEFVFAVAGAWSVDPTMIHETFPDAAPGFIGRNPAASAAEPAAKNPL